MAACGATLCLLFLLISLFPGVCKAAVNISTYQTEGRIGEQAVLHCTVSGHDGDILQIQWWKGIPRRRIFQQFAGHVGQPKGIFRKRDVSGYLHKAKGYHKLIIKNPTFFDTDSYVCEVTLTKYHPKEKWWEFWSAMDLKLHESRDLKLTTHYVTPQGLQSNGNSVSGHFVRLTVVSAMTLVMCCLLA